MAIKQGTYKIATGANTFDVIHFDNEFSSVQLLNNGALYGTLKDLMITGKKVTSGSIVDIKISGTYEIKGVSGLPSGFSSSTTYLLQVNSIGADINNPIITQYTLVDSNGIVKTMIKSGSKVGQWTDGGTSIMNTINNQATALGNLSELTTSAKSSLVKAINELKQTNDAQNNSLRQLDNVILVNDFVRTNHESTLRADLNLMMGKSILTTIGGTKESLLKTDVNNNFVIGNTKVKTSIKGTGDLIYNNATVWTSVNDGKDSQLDAGFLGGINWNKYARKDISEDYTGVPNLKNGVKVSDNVLLKGDAVGLAITHNGTQLVKLNRDRATLNSLTANGGDIRLQNGTTSFSHSSNSNGYVFKNDSNGATIATVSKTGKQVQFNDYISIQGKRLFLQPNEPSGTDHPVGSVWIS